MKTSVTLAIAGALSITFMAPAIAGEGDDPQVRQELVESNIEYWQEQAGHSSGFGQRVSGKNGPETHNVDKDYKSFGHFLQIWASIINGDG